MEHAKGLQLHNIAIWDVRYLPTTRSLIRKGREKCLLLRAVTAALIKDSQNILYSYLLFNLTVTLMFTVTVTNLRQNPDRDKIQSETKSVQDKIQSETKFSLRQNLGIFSHKIIFP